MEITEVKVFPVSEEKLKAFVSIVFDGAFMVNDLKVIQGREGLFISMPSRRKKSGEFKDVAHPLNSECRRMIESRVLGEYERVLSGRAPAAVADDLGVVVVAAAASRPDRHGTRALAPQPATLEEVEEFHLRDTFWSMG